MIEGRSELDSLVAAAAEASEENAAAAQAGAAPLSADAAAAAAAATLLRDAAVGLREKGAIELCALVEPTDASSTSSTAEAEAASAFALESRGCVAGRFRA